MHDLVGNDYDPFLSKHTAAGAPETTDGADATTGGADIALAVLSRKQEDEPVSLRRPTE